MRKIVGPCGGMHQIFEKEELEPANEQGQEWLARMHATYGTCQCCGKIANIGFSLCQSCRTPWNPKELN